jgi:hypothetical protein
MMARMYRLLVLLLAFTPATTIAAEESERSECVHDREAILELEFVAFDQTAGSGWRPLYEAGCYKEAAELVRDWSARHGLTQSIIPFHEAQLWGYAGLTDLAISIFKQLYQEGAADTSDPWMLYTEGNIAFLQRDKARLEAATARLAALPRPTNWDDLKTVDGRPNPLPWPANLNVMQAMLRCWNETYEVAAHCHLAGWRRLNDADQVQELGSDT